MTRDQAMDAATDHGPGWMAQDSDGSWFWFSEEPERTARNWFCNTPTADCIRLGGGTEMEAYCWGDSLEVVEA